MTKDEARLELLAAAAAEIDKLLAWEEVSERMTLTDMEDKILAARAEISERMLKKLIEMRAAKRSGEIPVNAVSGKRLHPKSRKKGG